MSRRSDNSQVLDYIKSLYLSDEKFLDIHMSAPAELRRIQLSFAEAQMVAFVFKMKGCKNILELGTLVGYSAAIMATEVPDSKITTVEKSEDNFNTAVANLQKHNLHNINPINADGIEFGKSYNGPQFDGIFLDANKASYPKYLEIFEPHLKTGGIIIADNTLLWGEVANDEAPEKYKSMHRALREYNTSAFDTERFESILIPTLDGMTISVKK